jgi:YbbR domain-containing protein
MLSQFSENWILKLLSLVFALVLWFFVMGERRQEIGFSVPLKLENIPQDLMVANEVPNLVDVRISGPRTLLMNLSPQDISISVDLKDLKPGLTSFKRLDEKLNIPSALKVTRLSPSFVDVKLERIKDKQIPVVPTIEGVPAEGFRLVETKLNPGKTIVVGAEGELKDVREVATDPISVTNVTESFSLMVPINYQGKYTRLKQQEAVEVQVTIEAVPPPVQKSDKTSAKSRKKPE